MESLNDHLQPAPSGSAPARRVALASTADPQAYNYRYMFEKIMDRSEGALSFSLLMMFGET